MGGVTGALDDPARLTCSGGSPALELVLSVPFPLLLLLLPGPDDSPFSHGISDSLAPGYEFVGLTSESDPLTSILSPAGFAP